MAANEIARSKLAEEILRWWGHLRSFRDLEKHDATLHTLLAHAENHLKAREWDEALKACQQAFSLAQPRNPLLSLDNCRHEGFCEAVIALYYGIVHIGLDDLDNTKNFLSASARHFDLVQFPLGAGLAGMALGRFLLLHDENTAAREYFNCAMDSLRLGFLAPPERAIRVCKNKMEKTIRKDLKSLGDKMADQPASAPPSPPPNPPPAQGERAQQIWVEEGFEEVPVLETEAAASAPGRGFEGERQIGKVRVGSVVLMDEVQYLPVNLSDGSNYLNLDRAYDHRVIRVSGQSMNRAIPVPIEDGDWIVVRTPRGKPFVPEDGTIVIATIPEVSGDRLLLKRIEITDAVIFLKSETAEPNLPEYQTRSFPRLKNEEPEVLFRAQALALLKPLRKVA